MTSVLENDVLLHLVYGFGHRERMKPVFDEVCVNHVGVNGELTEFICSDWCSPNQSDFVCFLIECYTQEERNVMKQRLLRCKCCSRHAHYKDVAYKHWDPVPESKTKECRCNCRHYARMFKRHNLA